MVPLPVLFADQVYDFAKPYIEKLPQLSVMPLLEDNIPAYVMVGVGALFLLVFLWRLITLRIFRALFALIATALVSYYPLAYGFHYWWFTYHAPEMEGRELESWETYVKDNWATIDYGIMAAGGVLGLLVLWLSAGGKKKSYATDDAGGRPGQAKNPFDFG